jgi:hypothetical protein
MQNEVADLRQVQHKDVFGGLRGGVIFLLVMLIGSFGLAAVGGSLLIDSNVLIGRFLFLGLAAATLSSIWLGSNTAHFDNLHLTPEGARVRHRALFAARLGLRGAFVLGAFSVALLGAYLQWILTSSYAISLSDHLMSFGILSVTAFSATLGLTLSSLFSRYSSNRFITTFLSSLVSLPLYLGIGYTGSRFLSNSGSSASSMWMALGFIVATVTILNGAFFLKAMQFKRQGPPKYDY